MVLSIFIVLSGLVIESVAAAAGAGAGAAMVVLSVVVSAFFSPHAATASTAATIKNFRIASPLGWLNLVTEAGTAAGPLSPDAPSNKL